MQTATVKMLNRFWPKHMVEKTITSEAFEEGTRKRRGIRFHSKWGGLEISLSVEQPSILRNEDKVGGDLCQEVKPYRINGL